MSWEYFLASTINMEICFCPFIIKLINSFPERVSPKCLLNVQQRMGYPQLLSQVIKVMNSIFREEKKADSSYSQSSAPLIHYLFLS